jgi:hypothetical protein
MATIRSLVASSGLTTAVPKTGLVTPTSALPSAATALARATVTPTRPAGSSTPVPTLASGLKPVPATTAPTRQAAPTASPAKPSAPTAGDATQVYVSEKLGIRVQGPQNWKVIERSDSGGVGDIAFYSNGSEQTQGMFARSGFISFQVFPLPPATEIEPEELFMGFVDGLVTEYTTSVGTDGQLSAYSLEEQKNSRYAGATTTFSITGAKGSLRYFWADHRIPNKPLAVQVACGASTERWDSVRPVCMSFYGMIEPTR